MTNSKGKLRMILLAFVVLGLMSVACNGSDNGNATPTPVVITGEATPAPTATAVVITGEATLDEIIVETTDAIETAQSTACKACLLIESAENCTGFCGTVEEGSD